MVRRFTAEEFHGGVVFEPDDAGDLVHFADYQALQAALREALDGWGSWADTMKGTSSEEKRIAELRKQFLDAAPESHAKEPPPPERP